MDVLSMSLDDLPIRFPSWGWHPGSEGLASCSAFSTAKCQPYFPISRPKVLANSLVYQQKQFLAPQKTNMEPNNHLPKIIFLSTKIRWNSFFKKNPLPKSFLFGALFPRSVSRASPGCQGEVLPMASPSAQGLRQGAQGCHQRC